MYINDFWTNKQYFTSDRKKKKKYKYNRSNNVIERK